MKLKYITAILASLLIIGVVGFANKSTVRNRFPTILQAANIPNTLGWYAQQAQAKGQSQYIFNAGIYEYIVPDTWDDVLASDLSFIVAEPLGFKSYSTPGANGTQDRIETRCKFKIKV